MSENARLTVRVSWLTTNAPVEAHPDIMRKGVASHRNKRKGQAVTTPVDAAPSGQTVVAKTALPGVSHAEATFATVIAVASLDLRPHGRSATDSRTAQSRLRSHELFIEKRDRLVHLVVHKPPA